MLTKQTIIAYIIAAILSLFASNRVLQHINQYNIASKTLYLLCALFILGGVIMGAACVIKRWSFRLALAGHGCIVLAIGLAMLAREFSGSDNHALFAGIAALIVGGVGMMQALSKPE